jgi:hypothetical protein
MDENVDGNVKTVHRGINVERAPSTANTSGTVETSENLAKNVEGNTKTVYRDEVRRNVSRERPARPLR